MDQQPIEIVVTQLLNDIIDQINDEYQNVQTCRQVTIKLDDIAAVEQSPTMLLSARRFLKMHQRVYSDPTVCLRSDRLMDTIGVGCNDDPIEGSSGSRRPNNNMDHHHVVADHLAWFGGESWVDAKNRLTAARLNDFEVSRELERENMHLYLSEMLIAAVEQMKWRSTVEQMQDLSTLPTEQNNDRSFDDSRAGNLNNMENSFNISDLQNGDYLSPSASFSLSSSSPDTTIISSVDPNTLRSFMSDELTTAAAASSVSCSHRQLSSDDDVDNSPEAIAASLIKHFSQRTHRTAGEIDWLVSYSQAPQLLLPMPDDIFVDPDKIYTNVNSSDSVLVRLRGTSDWAPPRKQWIFHLHPTNFRLREMLDKQKYRCAGCALKVDKKIYAKRVRYCDYYGRLFCQCCHQGAKYVIPARIMHQWNFKKYPVCDIARRFLSDSNCQPVLNAFAIEPCLYERVLPMRRMRTIRIKLVHMWEYIRTCRLASEVITKDGKLKDMFTSLPQHHLRDVDVYSLAEIEAVHSGQLFHRLEPIVQYCLYHIEGCPHCSAQAFLCQWCQSDELIYPFQLDKVRRCVACGSLAHRACIAKNCNGVCPKCLRLEQRRIRMARQSTCSRDETDENS